MWFKNIFGKSEGGTGKGEEGNFSAPKGLFFDAPFVEIDP
jgi:hypothetical protein